MKKTVLALAALALVVALVPIAGAAGERKGPKPDKAKKAKTTEIQILGLNDFHGAIEEPGGSGGRIGALTDVDPDPEVTNLQCLAPTCFDAGGVEFLATHVRELRATNPNTLFVSAGDLIGATPLISALFHDEPTIEAFNLMDLDYNGVGNHEFDEGVDELLRMQDGGCHPVDGCVDGDPFDGASFDFLAANVKYKDSGETIFPPYAIHKFQGVKVAIVGMTLEGTPDIVTPAGIQSVDFLDEADSVNALVPELRKKNIRTIIVLLHEGGTTSKAGNGAGSVSQLNECGDVSGPLPAIVERMHEEIDVVVTGHTNWAVNCTINGKIVTGAASNGRLVTDIDLTVSRASKDVVSATVDNKIVTREVEKAPDLTELVEKYRALVAPLSNRIVGEATAPLTRTANAAGESSLGDIIADAQLAATEDPLFGGSVVAFMNPGGIRGDLPAGPLTYGQLFTVQPFNNVLTVLTCSGAQIKALLEQQVFTGRMLQVSEGFSYTWDNNGTAGNRIDPESIKVDGVTLDPFTGYRVTTNNFLATGGDGFSTFTGCTDPLGGEIDLDAFVRYVDEATPPGVAPGPQDRITRVN